MSPQMRAVFRRPFDEQVAFFRGKLGNLVPTSRWDDLRREQHDRAFMVAGAAKADLLTDLAEAVDRAIADGESLEQFRARFFEIVQRHGWGDYTGSATAAGRAWRTRVIYRTNAATSYAAGRLAQLREFPLWVYKHGGSEDPRPQHLAWDGLTLPSDHPFWETHSPPNGWGCSCFLIGATTEEGARALGGSPGRELPGGWNDRDSKGRLPGIDQGWDYQPGGTVADIVAALSGKLDLLPPQPSIALMQSWLAGGAFTAWYAAPEGAWPLVRLSDADAAALGARPKVRVAYLSAQTARKQREAHPEISPEEYVAAQEVIDLATHRSRDGSSLVFIRERPGDGDTGGHVLVVKATQTGRALWVTSFRRLTRGEASRDSEVRRLLGKVRI